jgi:hypothetical protein
LARRPRGHPTELDFHGFFLLAESESAKRKYLYVLGTEYPLKFLNGGRSLKSVLSRNDTIRKAFYEHFGDRLVKVRDYYTLYREKVLIQDVSPWSPQLASDEVADETAPDVV